MEHNLWGVFVGLENVGISENQIHKKLIEMVGGFICNWFMFSRKHSKDTGKKKEDRGNKAKPKDTINFSLRNQQGNILTTRMCIINILHCKK